MIIIGHCLLALHLHRIRLSDSSTCQKCGKAEESRDHFLVECEAYAMTRLQYLGKPVNVPEDLVDVPLPSLIKFAIKSTRFKLHTETQGGTHKINAVFLRVTKICQLCILGVSLSILINR